MSPCSTREGHRSRHLRASGLALRGHLVRAREWDARGARRERSCPQSSPVAGSGPRRGDSAAHERVGRPGCRARRARSPGIAANRTQAYDARSSPLREISTSEWRSHATGPVSRVRSVPAGLCVARPGRRDEGEVRGGRRLFRRAWRAGAAGHGRRKGRLRALRPRVGGGAAAPPRQRHQELQRRPGRGGHPGPDHRELGRPGKRHDPAVAGRPAQARHHPPAPFVAVLRARPGRPGAGVTGRWGGTG